MTGCFGFLLSLLSNQRWTEIFTAAGKEIEAVNEEEQYLQTHAGNSGQKSLSKSKNSKKKSNWGMGRKVPGIKCRSGPARLYVLYWGLDLNLVGNQENAFIIVAMCIFLKDPPGQFWRVEERTGFGS